MPDDIPPTPWTVRETVNPGYPIVAGLAGETVAWIYGVDLPLWEYVIACVNLLAGVDPEAFPAIRDWLMSQGLAPMEDSLDA
jgi:hypothetical protein